METTEGSGDTPGFPLASAPYFERTGNGFRKLKMPRNHRKVNQCSKDMLHSWRANCDVQVFVYESDPTQPDVKEISKVTDYTVGYACKGSKTTAEEKKQILGFIETYTEESGDENDIKRLARKLLNHSALNRLISKQESLVLLLGLHLVDCSDRFDSVSTSGYRRISKNPSGGNTIVDRYKRRPTHLRKYSLHDFYHHTKNQSKGMMKPQWHIPHYTGGANKAVYPPTREYARSVFFIHRPWIGNFSFLATNWEPQFKAFIEGRTCPTVAALSYNRAMARHLDGTKHVEPVTKEAQLNDDNDEEMSQFLALTGMHSDEWDIDPEADGITFDYGINHDWTSTQVSRAPTTPDGTTWLADAVAAASAANNGSLDLPMKTDADGSLHHYEIRDLRADQQRVMAYVLKAVREWENHDARRHGPRKGLQLTVRGKAGSGKTVLLKTITSVLRRRYQSKSSVQIAAPTGVASYNAGGSTLHHLFGINPSNANSHEVTESVKRAVQPRLDDTVVLLLDERSMISTRLLGRIETVARHCAHGGFRTTDPWGGIPIVVMFGDDKQLPSIGRGVTSIPIKQNNHCRPPPEHNKLALSGQLLFQQFALDVMNLPVIKRQRRSQRTLARLLRRTRDDTLDASDVQFMRSLHLSSGAWDPLILRQIKQKSLWVYANVEPAAQHNIRELQRTSQATRQPVAWLKPKFDSSNTYRKAIKSHFEEGATPNATRLCVNAKVCLRGRNFHPNWGLFNGAIGTVSEIRYKPRANQNPNPNDGHLPDFVVVHFPHYCGPTWDEYHPKVCHSYSFYTPLYLP